MCRSSSCRRPHDLLHSEQRRGGGLEVESVESVDSVDSVDSIDAVDSVDSVTG